MRNGAPKRIRNDPEAGPWALMAAIFERARLDAKADNHHSDDARRFLQHPDTIRNLGALGIDPQYYDRLLTMTIPEATKDLGDRALTMYRHGLTQTDVALKLFRYASPVNLRRVDELVEAAAGEPLPWDLPPDLLFLCRAKSARL